MSSSGFMKCIWKRGAAFQTCPPASLLMGGRRNSTNLRADSQLRPRSLISQPSGPSTLRINHNVIVFRIWDKSFIVQSLPDSCIIVTYSSVVSFLAWRQAPYLFPNSKSGHMLQCWPRRLTQKTRSVMSGKQGTLRIYSGSSSSCSIQSTILGVVEVDCLGVLCPLLTVVLPMAVSLAPNQMLPVLWFWLKGVPPFL